MFTLSDHTNVILLQTTLKEMTETVAVTMGDAGGLEAESIYAIRMSGSGPGRVL